jgi:hypothetical protein
MSLVTPVRFLVAVAVVGLLVTAASAQQPGRGRGGFGGFGGGFGGTSPSQEKLRILANEAVQKELELAADQKTDIAKLAEEARTKGREAFAGIDFQGLRDLSQEERDKRLAPSRQKLDALAKDISKKIDAVLLPHQAERLQEIYVQVRGIDALTDEDIAKQLGLDEKQKEQLTTIRDENRRQMFQGGQGGFDRERFAALRKEREDKSLAVLTAPQKEKFAKMKGEAFAEVESLRFGGGRGQGGQGGQGGRPGQGGQGGQQRVRPGGNPNPNN